LLKQPAALVVHWPGCVGHWPLFWQTVLVSVQWPSFGHSPLLVQTALSVLQWPEMVGQSALDWQTFEFELQVPSSGQSAGTKQVLAGVTEQCPATAGHCALLVHADRVLLHDPVLGQSALIWQAALLLVHWPGGQLLTILQVGGHSVVQRLHPGGSQSDVQVAGSGGTHTGETRLQVGLTTPLQACWVRLLQFCGVTSLQVCALMPPQVWVPMFAHVCGVIPAQVCPLILPQV
jgi:hypothetical protein